MGNTWDMCKSVTLGVLRLGDVLGSGGVWGWVGGLGVSLDVGSLGGVRTKGLSANFGFQ